jgi:hypothetical protein
MNRYIYQPFFEFRFVILKQFFFRCENNKLTPKNYRRVENTVIFMLPASEKSLHTETFSNPVTGTPCFSGPAMLSNRRKFIGLIRYLKKPLIRAF